MTMDRRDFIKASSSVALAGLIYPRAQQPQSDAATKDLCMRALNAAKTAGASYADIRVARNRSQNVGTREQQIAGLQDSETFGCGVRVIADGAWGFAASRELTNAEVERVARLAVAQ